MCVIVYVCDRQSAYIIFYIARQCVSLWLNLSFIERNFFLSLLELCVIYVYVYTRFRVYLYRIHLLPNIYKVNQQINKRAYNNCRRRLLRSCYVFFTLYLFYAPLCSYVERLTSITIKPFPPSRARLYTICFDYVYPSYFVAL